MSTGVLGLGTASPPFAPGIDWAATAMLLGFGALALTAVGAGFTILLARRIPSLAAVLTRRRDTVDRPEQPPHVSAVGDENPDHAAVSERAALIAGYVKVRALLDDDIAVAVLDEAARAGGVTTFAATGMPVDPKRHRVDHTTPAPTPELDGVVAETLQPGYLDRERVLLPAAVIAYRWSRQ